ncbi:hypothetical protein DPMN_050658 [Dreissena polymorpha]|uniref:Uncharacterized protein n=1 Tax=Dreissena polymorpha TaxID=45954 RepID=A0A9D4CHM0_DREPO|nr:hypothetical protein DPMN_050658 [Dreissena polymorpha]
MLKQNFGWAWPMWTRLEIDRIKCRNEEVIVKGNFGWVWPTRAGPYRVVIRDVHYLKKCAWAWSIWAPHVEIDRIVIRDVQGSSAYSVGEDSGQEDRTDGQTAEITTLSPRSNSELGLINRNKNQSTDSTGATMLLNRMDIKASI